LKIYLVGGAVRDQLLGRPVYEKDWVVIGATIDQMLSLGYHAVGKDFPVFLHPQTHEEYALARTERKTGKGYTQFAFHADPGVTLEEDLLRRDLTINAMAQDEAGNIIDPYGGQRDLNNRILRHVSSAFAEDPVRILRVARLLSRYADLGFSIAPETYYLMRQMVRAGEVNALVPERVWQEFSLALMEPQPQQFFRVLRKCGALAILFPELDQLFGIPDVPQFHAEIDCGEHALLALTRAAKLNYSGQIRFAALLQNLGKDRTPFTQWPIHAHYQEDGVKLTQQLCSRYRASSNFRDLAMLTIRFHEYVYKALQLNAEELLTLFEKTDAFRRPERFQEFLLACEVNYCTGIIKDQISFSQKDFITEVLQKTSQVPITDLISQGLQNNELGNAIHQKRLLAINELLKKKQ
jgi:tRNA nucleotidyltransferase (CCA-adding enzyme)